jgi:hypothetical protein
VLCFCIACHRPVYSMLPVFQDCPFLIATSVLSNVDVIKKKSTKTIIYCSLFKRDAIYHDVDTE